MPILNQSRLTALLLSLLPGLLAATDSLPCPEDCPVAPCVGQVQNILGIFGMNLPTRSPVATDEKLAERIATHGEWLRELRRHPRYPSLAIDQFPGAVLGSPKRLNLTSERAMGANLSRADLRGALLRGTELGEARLCRAVLLEADLSRAGLSGANLCGANLFDATLSEANLIGANLRNAVLQGTNLEGALLHNAILRGAIWEPSVNPSPSDFVAAKEVGRLTYATNPGALVDLRNALREGGFVEAEKKVIAALRRHDARWWETVLFDWTCEFGSNNLRPIWLVGILAFLSAVMYWLAAHTGYAGLYEKRGDGHESLQKIRIKRWKKSMFAEELKAFSWACIFSLMTALRFGFRDFDLGRWIPALFPREVELEARGWVRSWAGFQSLCSLALVALAILSYIGRPFDL